MRDVVLVCEDLECLMLVATDLAGMGCLVVCARDLRQASDYVRAAVATRFVLVVVGEELAPPAELCATVAAHLPGWEIECDQISDLAGSVMAGDRFVN